MKQISTIVLIVLITSLVASGQCSRKATKLYEKAEKIQLEHKVKAIELLSEAASLCPDYDPIVFLLADLQLSENNYEEVRRVLSNYLRENNAPDPKTYFFLAKAEQKLFAFKDAEKNYIRFLESDVKSKSLRNRANRNLKHVQFAHQAYSNAPKIKFEALAPDINSDYSEYLPIMTADEKNVLFTRRIRGVEEAFYATIDEEGNWTSPNVLQNLPTKNRKASVTMSVDGNLIAFAMADDPQGYGNFDLYFMEYSEGKWSRPINFGPYVNSIGWESQPCLSADGKTVYFSADRKGGEGGNDIWKTKRQPDGSWSVPTNLGADINSPGNEESPFIHRDQRTLYFRSNGHPGLGDYDIFMSRSIRFKHWQEPVNLGYPINTIGNDGSLFVTLNGEEAFVASDVDHAKSIDYKDQVVEDNIDLFKFVLQKKYRPVPTTYIQLNFKDGALDQGIKPNILLLDYESNDTIYSGKPTDENTVLLCLPMNSSYALSAELENYQPYFERFEPQTDYWPNDPLYKTVNMWQVVKEDTARTFSPVVLKNVLFESNSSTLLEQSFSELNKLVVFLKENPTLHIEIRGHTDNVGEQSDNKRLSENRAKAVYDFLLESGTQANRLHYIGLGETIPIASNDSEQGRALNRRTEFIIIDRH